MKIFYRLLAALLLVAPYSEGRNEMITTQYNTINLKGLSESRRVTFATPGLLTITQSDTAAMEITAPEEVLERLSVSIDQQELSITLPKRLLGLTKDYVKVHLALPVVHEVTAEGSAGLNINPITGSELRVNGNGSGEIRLDAAELESLHIDLNGSGIFRANSIRAQKTLLQRSGSCEAWLGTVKSSQFEVQSKGSGDTHIAEIHAANTRFTLDGSGDLHIARPGFAKDQTVSVKGVAKFYGRNLSAEQAIAELNGSGVIEVSAQARINATVYGTGEIRYFGDPAVVNTQVKGSGAILSGDANAAAAPLAAN